VGPVNGRQRATYIPLQIAVRHPETLAEKLQWLQGIGLVLLSSISTLVLKPWFENMIGRRKRKETRNLIITEDH